jgi:hypothetical protein
MSLLIFISSFFFPFFEKFFHTKLHHIFTLYHKFLMFILCNYCLVFLPIIYILIYIPFTKATINPKFPCNVYHTEVTKTLDSWMKKKINYHQLCYTRKTNSVYLHQQNSSKLQQRRRRWRRVGKKLKHTKVEKHCSLRLNNIYQKKNARFVSEWKKRTRTFSGI